MNYSNLDDLINVDSHSETHRANCKSIVAKQLLFQSLGESLLSVNWQKSESKRSGKLKRNLLFSVSPNHKFF